MCSDHFMNRSGPSKEHSVHSVFPNKVFQTSNLESKTLELANSDFQLNEDMEQGDIAEQQSDDEDDSNDISEPFIAKTESPLDISIHLHDYCGPIHLNDIVASHIKNQSTQNNPLLRIDFSTQCDFNEMSPKQLKSLMYSDYKSHMTWKGLIRISPAGVVTFVSDLWAGSACDKQTTKDSALVDMCEPGDAIMADKGFLILDITTPKVVHLIIPPFKQKKKQFSKREVQQT